MITWHPPQVLVWFGDLPITFYGLSMATAIAVAAYWVLGRARRAHLPQGPIEDALFWTVLGGIVGARLGFLIQQDASFHVNPWHWIALWEGGLSFHGALFGGAAAALIFLKQKQRLNLFPTLADLGSVPILLAAAIGRLGNWANQELYGGPTDAPWGIMIDPAHRLPGYETFTSFHPTFAYEAMLNMIGVAVLLSMAVKSESSKSKIQKLLERPGTLGLLALGWYAIARGITEIWRISDRVIGPFSLAQLISLLILVGVAWSLEKRRRYP